MADETHDDAKHEVNLESRILPIEEAVTEGRLAVNLILKLIAELHRLGKLDDDEFLKVANTMVAELQSDQERFRAWSFFEQVIPDFERPDGEAKRKDG
jgi:hypothetical protein